MLGSGRSTDDPAIAKGQVAEWFKALDSKSSEPSKGSVGSTPTLSALCRWLKEQIALRLHYTFR